MKSVETGRIFCNKSLQVGIFKTLKCHVFSLLLALVANHFQNEINLKTIIQN
jgi:hypothetical protein